MNTVIVFGYDDTIFPTCAIKNIFKRNNPIANISKGNEDELLKRINAKELNELMQLSCITLNLLMVYVRHYSMKNILIVSASKRKWFDHSLSIVENIGFYKQIKQLLINFEIIKIHPMSKINLTSKNATQWKYNQFESILKNQKFFSDKNKKNKNSKKINTFVSSGYSMEDILVASTATHKWFKLTN